MKKKKLFSIILIFQVIIVGYGQNLESFLDKNNGHLLLRSYGGYHGSTLRVVEEIIRVEQQRNKEVIFLVLGYNNFALKNGLGEYVDVPLIKYLTQVDSGLISIYGDTPYFIFSFLRNQYYNEWKGMVNNYQHTFGIEINDSIDFFPMAGFNNTDPKLLSWIVQEFLNLELLDPFDSLVLSQTLKCDVSTVEEFCNLAGESRVIIIDFYATWSRKLGENHKHHYNPKKNPFIKTINILPRIGVVFVQNTQKYYYFNNTIKSGIRNLNPIDCSEIRGNISLEPGKSFHKSKFRDEYFIVFDTLYFDDLPLRLPQKL